MPYSPTQATVGVPNLIADMNKQDLAFTAHNGDLKAGSGSPCDDALYTQALGYFNSLRAPAVFTPGDNDWTDCDRPANGGYSSLERLDHERRVFFSRPFSLGRHRMRQDVQTAELCLGVGVGVPHKPVPCVENRRWTIGGVTYATLNIQGSCNNLCDTAPDAAEYSARNQANIAWLHETFDEARARRSAAIMLISQANPGWDLSDGDAARTRATPDAQPDRPANPTATWGSSTRCATQVIAFRKPVAYVHGDSHYFRDRQAVPRLPGPPARELHARRDVRQQRAERQQRRAVGEGARGRPQPRRLRLPAADRAREPDSCSHAVVSGLGSRVSQVLGRLRSLVTEAPEDQRPETYDLPARFITTS